MLTAPIPATSYALEKAGMTLEQIDLIEINEAFATCRAGLAARDRRRPGGLNVNPRARSPSATRSAPPAPG